MDIITKQNDPAEWVSSLVIAEKQNGAIRVCIDPKHLNNALLRYDYPITSMGDILPRLSQAKVFTVVDVKSG